MGTVSDLMLGVRTFGRGAALVARSGRLLRLGAVPALITTLLYVVALVVLLVWIDDLAVLVTPFADGWSAGLRGAVRVAAGLALLAGAAAIGVVAFVAVTLAVGGPFYERLSEIVDDEAGDAPVAPERSWAVSVARGLRDALRLVALSVLVAIPLVVLGFVPVVGQVAAPVLAALVGGWLLVLELTGPAGERREMGLGERHRALRSRRWLAVGVGVPTYLLCAIPFVAIVAMPAGAAAATLLLREVAATPRKG